MSNRSFIVLIFSVLFFNSVVPAADSLRTYPKVRIHMNGVTEEFGENGYLLIEKLEKAFAEKNLVISKEDNSATEVVIEIREINKDHLAVSIIILEPMDKDAIALGAQAELLYANLTEEKKAELPLNGKAIREYASSEYLKQFRMLWKNYLEIISKEDIDKFSKKIVEDYLEL